MYCGKCGKELTGKEKFCPRCGSPIPGREKTVYIKRNAIKLEKFS